jgi:hypothetical protein
MSKFALKFNGKKYNIFYFMNLQLFVGKFMRKILFDEIQVIVDFITISSFIFATFFDVFD